MSRLMILAFSLIFSVSAFPQDLALKGFRKRFTLVKDESGKVSYIKLNKAVTNFTIMPFIEQIKKDLTREQGEFFALGDVEKERQVNKFMNDIGYGDLAEKSLFGYEEAQAVRDSLLAIKYSDIDGAFSSIFREGDFWKEFQRKLQEAFMFIDPTVLANLNDARFFYKRAVTYEVIKWALQEAQKRFSDVPVLNIASFIIVRVHDMMLEQRHFHHNMLLHYFEVIPETKLGMTKEEVDRSVSSIYEYRIEYQNILESNRAAANWQSYGFDNFYRMVRAGNSRVRGWQVGWTLNQFTNVKKINFGFAQVTERVKGKDVERIYHLHVNAHQYSRRPALAYDFSQPSLVKRNRTLFNLAGVALGFLKIPGQLKGAADNFLKSLYVQQVRMEGALVGHFESQGNQEMISRIYAQRANFYIVE
jgi:hypothetical protein